ncbi:MAG: DUF1003 domain-containing protein [Patescibacteria group bacterium]|nr:DUF1003 domain-containing protein [Patescibacteria group bacterium]
MPFRHPVNQRHRGGGRTRGERYADNVASAVGSWRFIIIQTGVVLAWVGLNLAAAVLRWDPYPFILLNLMFSLQAAYTGPVLQLAGNRQADHQVELAEHAAKNTDLLQQLLEQNTQLTKEIHESVTKS